MATDAKQVFYQGAVVQNFQFYLKHTGEHDVVFPCIQDILLQEFKGSKKAGVDSNSLDVLGVGSGTGELDVKMLGVLQSTLPDVPITAEIVDCSSELTDIFKAVVAKTPTLEKIPFLWHIKNSEDYEKEVKANGKMKTFDFIHMVQMIYYLNNFANAVKFYHSLLKKNGRLMIICDAQNSGWDILWKTYYDELCIGSIAKYCSATDIIACLKNLALTYEERIIPNTMDITECFDPDNERGKHLLSILTEKNFYEWFSREMRAGILDLLRNKCSTVKDGRVIYNCDLSCILIHA